MPRFDGTGPWGYGPGSGWGMGVCYGRRGFGWRRPPTKQEETEDLEDEKKFLEEELQAVERRLKDLKGQK